MCNWLQRRRILIGTKCLTVIMHHQVYAVYRKVVNEIAIDYVRMCVGLCSGVPEVFTLLGYYAPSMGNWFPTFWNNVVLC